jgi:hypothetical protein
MNKKKSIIGICSGLMLILALGITSCTKEGPAGAKGDTGAAGTPGATGPQGPAGNPGTPGTPASVYYSPWTDVTYTAVDQNSDGTTDYYRGTINAPKLVDSILQRGEIKVYLNLNTAAAPQIMPLPYADYIMPFFSLNTITLQAFIPNTSTTTVNGSKIQQYRYILIPGLVTGRTKGVNWDNYEEVKKYLGLKD